MNVKDIFDCYVGAVIEANQAEAIAIEHASF